MVFVFLNFMETFNKFTNISVTPIKAMLKISFAVFYFYGFDQQNNQK